LKLKLVLANTSNWLQLRTQRPLHVQVEAGHPGLEGRGGGEAQGVADPQKTLQIVKLIRNWLHELIQFLLVITKVLLTENGIVTYPGIHVIIVQAL
jgi:hypothetical protein